MCSTCGASALRAPWRRAPRAGARRSGAARRRRRRRGGRSTTVSSISACVPTMSDSSPVASWPRSSRRRAAGVEPVSSAAGTASPGISAWSVAKCCSASVSVGAISAACMPCSTARSIACRATTVLPEPTSPISRRCIGRSPARSASIFLDRVALVAGRRERQQRLAASAAVSEGSPSRTAACGDLAPRRRVRAASAASWTSSSSSNARRRRPPSVVAEVGRRRRPRTGPAGARRRAAGPAAARRRPPRPRGARARARGSASTMMPFVAG